MPKYVLRRLQRVTRPLRVYCDLSPNYWKKDLNSTSLIDSDKLFADLHCSPKEDEIPVLGPSLTLGMVADRANGSVVRTNAIGRSKSGAGAAAPTGPAARLNLAVVKGTGDGAVRRKPKHHWLLIGRVRVSRQVDTPHSI